MEAETCCGNVIDVSCSLSWHQTKKTSSSGHEMCARRAHAHMRYREKHLTHTCEWRSLSHAGCRVTRSLSTIPPFHAVVARFVPTAWWVSAMRRENGHLLYSRLERSSERTSWLTALLLFAILPSSIVRHVTHRCMSTPIVKYHFLAMLTSSRRRSAWTRCSPSSET